MTPINVMINGLPGKVALTIAEHTVKDTGYNLVPYSLTGPDISEDMTGVLETQIRLVRPDKKEHFIGKIKKEFSPFFVIDFTHPSAVNENAEFYVSHEIPFVMGTTGGDREQLENTVKKGSVPAVIAPNMAKQIVGFQAMMEYAARQFPDLFKGFTLEIKESHQQGKADTSGTARAMVEHFNALGVNFEVNDIQKVRDPDIQREEWNIPEEHLSGHAFHTYTLTAPDGSCTFRFQHNILGREVYVKGSLDAVEFINKKMSASEKHHPKLYTMIDVLQGA
ncbi:MAG: dihydrodipicolinate reductase [Desulfobacteraceae bacterium]